MVQKSFLVLFILFCCFNYGQQNILDQINYKEAKINLKTYTQLAVKNLTVSSTAITFYDTVFQKEGSLPLSEVKSIYVKKGNYFGRGALYGALLMSLSSLSAVNAVNLDPEVELKDNSSTIISVTILSGAAIGGLIGSFFPKWKPIELPSDKNNVSFKTSVLINHEGVGLSFILK